MSVGSKDPLQEIKKLLKKGSQKRQERETLRCLQLIGPEKEIIGIEEREEKTKRHQRRNKQTKRNERPSNRVEIEGCEDNSKGKDESKNLTILKKKQETHKKKLS